MTASLLAIVGSSGVGKTTFARALSAASGYRLALEQHSTRPFQALFSNNLTRYALANQVDYLLLRAEQERHIRQSAGFGIVDGGLDQDFFIFTRLFYAKGYLDGAEFALCERLYRQLRAGLPSPDLTVWFEAPPEVIADRFAARQRALQIAQIEDLHQISILLQEWLAENPPHPVITLDVAQSTVDYRVEIDRVLEFIDKLGL